MFQIEPAKTTPQPEVTESPTELKKSFSWSEKNCSDWAKDRLKQLLNEVSIAEDNSFCRISEVNQLTGEFLVFNKKSKRSFSYDFEVYARYQGQTDSDKEISTGEIHIPHMGEEYGENEFEIQFTGEEPLKTFAKEMVAPLIREKVIQLLKELGEEYEIEKTFPKIEKVSRSSLTKSKSFIEPKASLDPGTLEAKGYKMIGSNKNQQKDVKKTPTSQKSTPKESEKKIVKPSPPKNVTEIPIDWYKIGKWSLIIMAIMLAIPTVSYCGYKFTKWMSQPGIPSVTPERGRTVPVKIITSSKIDPEEMLQKFTKK